MGSKRRHAKGQGADSFQTPKDRQFDGETSTISKVGEDISPSQDATPLRSAGVRDLSTRATGSKYAKRSRRLGTVTSHACAACRTKRAKCDGETPCRRCMLRGAECIYKATVSQSKAQLRAEVYALRQRQHTLEQLVAAVARPEHCQDALAYMQSGKFIDSSSKLPNSSLASSSHTTGIDSGIEFSTYLTQSEPREPIAPNPRLDDPTLDADRHPGMQDVDNLQSSLRNTIPDRRKQVRCGFHGLAMPELSSKVEKSLA